jgi:hypothetical protein
MPIFESGAKADLVQYRFEVDTSSLAGQSVSLFFAASGWNDGPGSAVGNVATVPNFSTDAVLQPPAVPFGLTSGDFPSTLLLPFDHEAGGVNARAQYLIDAVLGNSISFDVTLEGDQLGGTNPVPYAGFEFTIQQGLNPVWLSPAGFASAEVYRENGVLAFEFAPQITITAVAVPESGWIAVIGSLGVGAATCFQRRRRTAAEPC